MPQDTVLYIKYPIWLSPCLGQTAGIESVLLTYTLFYFFQKQVPENADLPQQIRKWSILLHVLSGHCSVPLAVLCACDSAFRRGSISPAESSQPLGKYVSS